MKIRLPYIAYAAIDPGGAGGGGAAPGAEPGGSAPTPTPQPGGQGQGQGGGFREQFFPNVPDEVWSQVEPHIGEVNKHVTQLQQRYAPFKGYRDQDLQGLAQFSEAFNQDPVGQWLRMAHGMQAAGVLDGELDLEHLEAIIKNQLPPEPNEQLAGDPNGDMPPWAQQLMQRLDQLEGGVNQFQSSHRQQVEDAVLQRQVGFIKAELKKAGIADGTFSEEQILASYIAHRGNAAAAAKSFVDARNALLKGYVKNQTDPEPPNGDGDLDLPNGAPPVRNRSQRRERKGAMIPGQAKAAAEQFLRQQGRE